MHQGGSAAYWADITRYNLAEALLEQGETTRAARVVDRLAESDTGSLTNGTDLVRAAVALRLGRVDDLAARWSAAPLPAAQPALRREFRLHRLEFAFWVADPGRAVDEALTVLEDAAPSDQSRFLGALFTATLLGLAEWRRRDPGPDGTRRSRAGSSGCFRCSSAPG